MNSIAQKIAAKHGFDINLLRAEKSRIISRSVLGTLCCDFGQFSQFDLFNRCFTECSRWRCANIHHDSNISAVRRGALAECFIALLYDHRTGMVLERWFPTIAVNGNGSNTNRDIEGQWANLDYNMEVKCIQPHHQYLPTPTIESAVRYICVVELTPNSFEFIGFSTTSDVVDHGKNVSDLGCLCVPIRWVRPVRKHTSITTQRQLIQRLKWPTYNLVSSVGNQYMLAKRLKFKTI